MKFNLTKNFGKIDNEIKYGHLFFTVAEFMEQAFISIINKLKKKL